MKRPHKMCLFLLPQVERILTHNVLPSLTLLSGQTALVFEIWAVLSQLPYTSRFRLYAGLAVRHDSLANAVGWGRHKATERVARRVAAGP